MAGERLADLNRREMNDVLRRAANAAFTSPSEITGAQRVVEANTAGGATDRFGRSLDTRPTLKDWLKELRFGKPPEPPAPDPSEVAREKAAAALKERIVSINAELVQQPRRKEELERTRDALAQQLWALQAR